MALSQLFDPEPIESTDPSTANPTLEERLQRAAEVKAKIRQTLAQAADLQCLAYEVAMDLKERSSSSEEEDNRRARAQAVASAIKAWDISADRIRILKGKGLPGKVDAPAKVTKRTPSMFTESKPE